MKQETINKINELKEKGISIRQISIQLGISQFKINYHTDNEFRERHKKRNKKVDKKYNRNYQREYYHNPNNYEELKEYRKIKAREYYERNKQKISERAKERRLKNGNR